jgi:hypothetical protein
MDQKPKDTSSMPEEVTGMPKDLASAVSKEEEGPLEEAIGDVVPPPPPARMMKPSRKARTWDYWSS